MNKITNQDSQSISILRFPLATMIVVLHSMNVENMNVNIPWELYNASFTKTILDILRVFFSRVLGHIVVPCFMIISGYLFFIKFEKWNWHLYKNKLQNRIKTLFIPYILWNIIPVLISLLWLRHENLISNYLNEIQETGILNMFWSYRGMNEVSFFNIPIFCIGTPFNTPLWFLRDLIIFILFSPIIFVLIKRVFYPILIILILWSLNGGNADVYALMWFYIGASFSIKNISISKFSTNSSRIIIPIFILSGSIKLFSFHEGDMLLWEKIIHTLSIMSGISTIFIIASKIKCQLSNRYKKYIASSSFLIYVLHMEFLWRSQMFLEQLIFINAKNNVWQAFAVYSISVFTTIAGLLITNFIMIKYFPRLNYILTANR